MPTTHFPWVPLTADGWDWKNFHQPGTRVGPESPGPGLLRDGVGCGVLGAGNNTARNLWVTLAQSW